MSVKVSNDEVVEYLCLTGSYGQVYRDLAMRKVTSEAARKSGLNVNDNELQQAADAFRTRYKLHSSKDTQAWLQMSGLTVEQFEKHLETNLLVEKWKDKLREQTDANAYVNRQPTADVVRDLVFQDWVRQQIAKA